MAGNFKGTCRPGRQVGWVLGELDGKEGTDLVLPGPPTHCPARDTSLHVVLSLAPLPLKMGTS